MADKTQTRVTLSPAYASCGWALPRLADAVKHFAKNPSASAYLALEEAMKTYQNAKNSRGHCGSCDCHLCQERKTSSGRCASCLCRLLKKENDLCQACQEKPRAYACSDTGDEVITNLKPLYDEALSEMQANEIAHLGVGEVAVLQIDGDGRPYSVLRLG